MTGSIAPAGSSAAGNGLPPSGGGSRRKIAWSLLALSGGYFLAGKAGLLLAVGNASVSTVWPPTGIAIAALLLGGSELWPAVFVGAFAVNVTTTGDLASSLGIAAGNSLEAIVGAYLAARFAGGKGALNSPQTVLAFALLGGLLPSTIAATIGTASLTAVHLASSSNFLGVWVPWWLGDSIGAIEFAPLLLALSQRLVRPSAIFSSPGVGEAIALGIVTFFSALLVFGRAPGGFLAGYTLVFLVIPPIIWAAMRFGPLGATASASTVSVVAILSTVAGRGPFATLPPDVSLLALRVFIGSVVVAALVVAAEVFQHYRLETELYRTRKELQRMLQERNAELAAARSLARGGNWTFDVATQKLVWSEEMYGLFGYGDSRFPVVLENAFDRVDARDRRVLLAEIRRGIDSSDPRQERFSELKLRLELPSHERRTLLSKLEVRDVSDGKAARLVATVQDISEKEHVEEELRRLRTAGTAPEVPSEGFLMWMVPWLKERKQ